MLPAAPIIHAVVNWVTESFCCLACVSLHWWPQQVNNNMPCNQHRLNSCSCQETSPLGNFVSAHKQNTHSCRSSTTLCCMCDAVPPSAKPPWIFLVFWGPTATAAAQAWPTLTPPGPLNPKTLCQQACPRQHLSPRMAAQTLLLPSAAHCTPAQSLQSRQSLSSNTACSTSLRHSCRHLSPTHV